MDLRLAAALAAASVTALSLTSPRVAAAQEPPQPPVSREAAIATSKEDDTYQQALREHPGLRPSASRNENTGDWEVGFYSDDEELVQVVVDDQDGEVEETWTGYQVAWRMARGYPGAFGRKLNAPYVWLPLCAIFVLGLFDWRRPFRIAHLDLLVIVAGFGLSHYFFNRSEIGVSVPLAYPTLLYLLGRALWLAFRGGTGLRPTAPALSLAVMTLFLVGLRVGLNVADSNVIDVGYSGVIGADKIVDGEALYGSFPEDNRAGDTYGPVSYYAYVPFEQLLSWSGDWDDLPAAHAAAIFFELGTLAGLFMLGRRLRRGEEGRTLGILLCFAWAACPYTAFALESNTNDALVSMLLVLTLLFITSPPARGIFLALASLTKFAPFALAPLFATYGATTDNRDDSANGGAVAVSRDESATGGAPGGPIRGRIRARRMGDPHLTGGSSASPTEPPRITGPVARYVRVILPFAAAFAITVGLAMAQTLLDPGLSTFWDRTIGNQAGRDSPFSIWGQEPSLEWLHTAVKVATVGLALLVAFVPRRRDPVTVAALGAAVLIALQLTVDHWFYLYLPWFLPFFFVALLARGSVSTAR
ncbi:MAG: hypothetical protein ACRDK5_04640 [Solirubrobacterales bacterium]